MGAYASYDEEASGGERAEAVPQGAGTVVAAAAAVATVVALSRKDRREGVERAAAGRRGDHGHERRIAASSSATAVAPILRKTGLGRGKVWEVRGGSWTLARTSRL